MTLVEVLKQRATLHTLENNLYMSLEHTIAGDTCSVPQISPSWC